MFRTVVIASALVVGLGAAFAQSNAIDQRKASMKKLGGAAGPVGQMLQGKAPFDLAKVKESFGTIAGEAKAAILLFPADSKTGGDTKALPAIWEKKAEFDAHFAKLEADATAAVAGTTDEASFKANAGKVLGSCGACHKDFRAPSN